MSIPLPDDLKKCIQEIADEKGYEVRDPGSFFTAKDGKVWVLVVDKATDASLWVSVSGALPNKIAPDPEPPGEPSLQAFEFGVDGSVCFRHQHPAWFASPRRGGDDCLKIVS